MRLAPFRWREAATPTLGWILAGGLAMSAIALSGAIAIALPRTTLRRLIGPLVALAAGSLLGGALFHLLPAAIEEVGNELRVYAALAAGFLTFFMLEQTLHWRHAHQPNAEHRPLGYLILVADGLHNFLGGIAVGGAFLVDQRVGMVTWVVAAAHEVPQELGDFGILVEQGWGRREALAYNVASGLTFLGGALLAYAISGVMDVALLIPFAAGNFIYISTSDLLPELREPIAFREKLEPTAIFAAALAALFIAAAVAPA